jgi:HEAT repeat protein
MPEESKSTMPPGTSAGTPAPIQQAVMDLCIARRTLMIYPSSHDQVKRSLRRAYHSLSAVLEPESSITLTVIKEDLGINNRILDSKSTAFSDLAAVLKQYQIATLEISNGLEYKEFVRFLRLMTEARDKIMAQGGIAAVAGRNRLDHVVLRTVDYSKLQLTEEREILRSSRRESDGSLWQAFVADLLSGEDPAPASEETATGNSLDPGALAALLNRGSLSPDKAIDHYERAMADATGHPTDSSTAISHGLQLFQQMIHGLNPELQNQFLATTFDRCAQSLNAADTNQLFEGLGADLIVRMLDQANSDGKQISPSLMAFICKVGHLNRPGEEIGTSGGGDADSFEGLSQSKIESLLAHEQHDTYVDSGYGRLLNDLTLHSPPEAQAPLTESWMAGMAAGLSDAGIYVHAARAMARMMAVSADAAGYRDWARQLAYLLDDLLEVRAFGYLKELMGIVRAEAAGHDPQRTEIAGLLLNRFSDTQFVANAVEAARVRGKDPSPEALGFLTALGEPVVLEIFDSVDPERILEEKEGFIQILKSLSVPAIREALERIKDPRPENAILMIRIIRIMGDSESAQQMRSLLDHSDPDIRTEALATLLKFNNNWGRIRLRELLAQPTASEFASALDLAGEYGVRDVVPQLLAYLKKRGGPELREAVVRALGRIGDSRAIPELTRLAQRRWSISRKQNERFKQVLFLTLGGYPFGEIKHLLHLGLKQKDESIQAVCRRLLREGTRQGAP